MSRVSGVPPNGVQQQGRAVPRPNDPYLGE
jgi:hypothetical protein